MNITIQEVQGAHEVLRQIVPSSTPLQYCERLSKLYKAHIYLKREDLTKVRSFKLRGAYYKMSLLKKDKNINKIICASAGNHAQGVALSCAMLKIPGTIYMPITTPNQKIAKVKYFGSKWVDVVLKGNTFDEASSFAQAACKREKAQFVHPFDDRDVIVGQATVGYEIYEDFKKMGRPQPQVVLVPVGGGGLISGIASYMNSVSKDTVILGVEPEGAASMVAGLQAGKPARLERLDTFVDGAAVQTTGKNTLQIVKKLVKDIIVPTVGAVCSTMIEMYQSEGIITEPAGALSVAALEYIKRDIRDKTVVCVVSGGNNDLLRYPEIMEKSLVYKGLKHYFILEFAQKPGQLRAFLNKALGPQDDIVLFEYLKRTNKEKGSALVGIELSSKESITPLLKKMASLGLSYKKITSDDDVFQLLV